jgi:uncharacterized membrane protein YeaQ/YmgE (transglycosylase-associated protein family)
MELKVVCDCGQKFKFDVEPVDGRMPFTVNCPVCNLDGTAAANALLAEKLSNPPPLTSSPPPPEQAAPPPAPAGLRINRTIHVAPGPAAPSPPTGDVLAPPPIGAFRKAAAEAAKNPAKPPSFGMGLLGGFMGALVGVIIYFLIFKYTGYRIKLLAIGVGALAGWFAEFLGKGEGSKELGGITAVLVLAGVVGAQYFVALGWWNEGTTERLKEAQSAYSNAVATASAVVKAIPTGSDAEIRVYLAKVENEEGGKANPATISGEEVKDFRDNQLPEIQGLASGQITKEQFEQRNEIKTAQTKEEKASEEGTFKAIFLLLLISKTNLFSLAAAAGLAFKLSTNA